MARTFEETNKACTNKDKYNIQTKGICFIASKCRYILQIRITYYYYIALEVLLQVI